MPQDTEYRFKACGDQLYVEEKGTRCWTGSVEVASGKHRVRNSDGEIVGRRRAGIGDAIPSPSCALQDTSAPWKHEKPTEYVPERTPRFMSWRRLTIASSPCSAVQDFSAVALFGIFVTMDFPYVSHQAPQPRARTVWSG